MIFVWMIVTLPPPPPPLGKKDVAMRVGVPAPGVPGVPVTASAVRKLPSPVEVGVLLGMGVRVGRKVGVSVGDGVTVGYKAAYTVRVPFVMAMPSIVSTHSPMVPPTPKIN